MNNINHMIMRLGIISACFALLASCTPSTSVVRLMDQAIKNEDLLAKQHQLAYKNQQIVTRTLPELFMVASSNAFEACQAQIKANVDMLKARIDAAEKTLRIRFGQKAWKMVSDQFPVKFQASYQSSVNALLDEERKKLKSLDEKRKEFPNDAEVAVEYGRKRIQVNSLYLTSFEDENRLRNDLMDKLEKTRFRVFRSIDQSMKNIRKRVEQIEDNACSEPTPVPEKLIILQNDLEQLRDPVFILHAEQKAALETVRDYINRPSQVELILVGAGEVVTGKIANLQQSAQAGLNGLGEMISDIGGDIVNTALSETESLGIELERLVGNLNGKINSEIGKINNGLTKEASSMAIKVSTKSHETLSNK